MAVRFFLICGGNPSTRRKPPTCRKSLTNFYHIMLYWIHLTWAGFEFTISGVISTEYIGICKSNYHTSTTTTASFVISINNLLIIYLPFMIYLFIALYLHTHTHTHACVLWPDIENNMLLGKRQIKQNGFLWSSWCSVFSFLWSSWCSVFSFLWSSWCSVFSFCVVLCKSLFLYLFNVPLPIILSVLLRFTTSNYPFDIFKHLIIRI